MNKYFYIIIFLVAGVSLKAQNVTLSQPQIASQFLNPATVGTGLYKQRIQSNLRTQLLNGEAVYSTAVLGWDTRLNYRGTDIQNYLGLGAQIISDRLMAGAIQNNHITVNMAYHLFFNKSSVNDLALGIGITYSQMTYDKTKLIFGDQYYASGVYSGVSSMEDLKSTPSKVSASTGILYTRHGEMSFLQTGLNVNFMSNPEITYSALNESEAMRTSGFLNAETMIFNDFTFLFHASTLEQNTSRKFTMGGAISLPITSDWEKTKRLYIGCYSRFNEALIPTVSLLLDKYAVGFSYEMSNSNVTVAQTKQNNFEISFSRSFGYRKDILFRTIFD